MVSMIKLKMKNKNWDADLTPEQNYILKQEGTEPPGSSPLNNEKREGAYYCAGCGIKLFDSGMKFIGDLFITCTFVPFNHTSILLFS